MGAKVFVFLGYPVFFGNLELLIQSMKAIILSLIPPTLGLLGNSVVRLSTGKFSMSLIILTRNAALAKCVNFATAAACGTVAYKGMPVFTLEKELLAVTVSNFGQ